MFALLFVLVASVSAQRKQPKLDDMLSVNSAQGREFWIAVPPNELNPFPVDELEIYVASLFDTEIEVFDASAQRTYKRTIQANQIRTLSDGRGETNWTWEVRESEQVVRKGVRITSKHPISVYVLNSKVTSSDGYLAIPTTAWGTDYINCSYWDFREARNWAGGFLVIAKEEGTTIQVDLRGSGELDARTAGGRRINTGQLITQTLGAGDIYMVKGDGTTRGLFDLTGSRVRSNKPIGFIPLHERTTMPNMLINGNGRNHLCEMMPPVNTWGKKYTTVEYLRENLNGQGKGDVFRVVASQPGTKWTMKAYDLLTKQVIKQDGGVLNRSGDFADVQQSQVPTNLPSGFTVWEADKPVFVMQYSCSQSWDGDPILDPFMIIVVPEEQFITSTIFQTPVNGKFQKHRLNLIVWADSADPDYIANLQSLEIDGQPVWRHPGAIAPNLISTRMPNMNLHFARIDFGTESRPHRITGNGKVKFGGYIYGFGAADAYGWPAASGFRPTTSFDTMPPVLTETNVCGDYEYVATELRNIPNPPVNPPKDSDQVETGIAEIDFVIGSASTNYRIVLTQTEFNRDPKTTRTTFRLEVIDKSQPAYAEFYVSDYADNRTYDTVSYTPDRITFSPNPIDFGKRRVGDKPTLDVVIRNDQPAPVDLSELRLLVGGPYTITAGAIPPTVTIPSGGTHTVTIEYDASRDSSTAPIGKDLDTMFVKTTCSEFKLPITGFAVEPIIAVDDWDAGTVDVNQRECLGTGLRIRNLGSETLVITSIAGDAGTNFTLSNPTTPPLPISIPPKGQVLLQQICYQRADVGTDDIDVTFTTNATKGDSVSKWKGQTQSPGPNISGYDWLERRVNTLHAARVYVWNTGNQALTVTDVTFADGTRYYPPGSNEGNYVFKIVGMSQNGTAVTTANIVGDGSGTATDSVDVDVLFRPDAEANFTADIRPVFQAAPPTIPTRQLRGVGILPEIASAGWNATCEETQPGIPLTRNIDIINDGTMDLTITGLGFATGTANTWSLTTPQLPLTIPIAGRVSVPVTYTRPAGDVGASTATIEINHDAVPGIGTDATTLQATGRLLSLPFNVASCDQPEISVANIDFGRQAANCDAPILEFPINVTGRGSLDISAIAVEGADQASFRAIEVLMPDNSTVPLPLTNRFVLLAGQTARVRVQFTPTRPNPVTEPAPWVDVSYAAQVRVTNHITGEPAEFQQDLLANIVGSSYVSPISIDLTNDLAAQQTREPGRNVSMTVRTTSSAWNTANVTALTVHVVYETKALAYAPGSIQTAAAGWTFAEPTISTDPTDANRSRLTFVGSGPALTGDGALFTFDATLLLFPATSMSQTFTSTQTLVIEPIRPCVPVAVSGDSTALYNCAITRRLVSLSSTQTRMDNPTPNPSTGGDVSVDFAVGIPMRTVIELVDMSGNVVRTFANEKMAEGEYNLRFPTAGLQNGAYVLRMSTSVYTTTKKIVIAD